MQLIYEGSPCDSQPHDYSGPLVLIWLANGVAHIKRKCTRCKSASGSGIRKSDHPNWRSYPVLNDYRGSNPECAKCGNPHTEFHHYWPSHLWPHRRWTWGERDTPTHCQGEWDCECDDWLAPDTGDFLCRDCHQEWHRLTRTGSYSNASR